MNSIIIGASYIGKSLLLSFCIWVFAIIWFFIFKLQNRLIQKQYYIQEALVLAYIFFLLITTGLIGHPWKLYGIRNISFSILPSNIDEMKQCALNIALFIPLGICLPLQIPKKIKWYNIVLIGFLFSTVIEITQVILIGRIGELGDILYNTAGTAIGFLIFRVLNIIYTKSEKSIGMGTLSIDFVLLAILSGIPLKHILVSDVWVAAISWFRDGIYHGIHFGAIIPIIFCLVAYLIAKKHKSDFGAKIGFYLSPLVGVTSLSLFIVSLFKAL